MTLPDIIILFGAPASGKGTQAENLKVYLQPYNYEHLDFGAALRDYVAQHIGNYKNLNLNNLPKIDSNTTPELALSIQAATAMLQGNPLEANMLWQILGSQIDELLNSGKRLIIEGLGRTVEDARRFGKIASHKHLKVAIFQLCITLEESLKRSATRFYVNGFIKPFSSLAEAKKFATAEHQIWQRAEDLDVEKIKHRYKVLYSDIFAKVLSTLQMECLANIFIIDGRDSIEEDFGRIQLYLQKFYDLKIVS